MLPATKVTGPLGLGRSGTTGSEGGCRDHLIGVSCLAVGGLLVIIVVILLVIVVLLILAARLPQPQMLMSAAPVPNKAASSGSEFNVQRPGAPAAPPEERDHDAKHH